MTEQELTQIIVKWCEEESKDRGSYFEFNPKFKKIGAIMDGAFRLDLLAKKIKELVK